MITKSRESKCICFAILVLFFVWYAFILLTFLEPYRFDFSVQTVLDSALSGEETANFEFPLMTKAGARIEILLNATTRRDEHGKIIGVVGIGQDITARLAQEREYSKLIDSANAPIFGVDNKGRVNVWNQCAMRLVGYSPEEVVSSTQASPV